MRDCKLHIELLGNFRLINREKLVRGIDTPRMQELLTYLLLNQHTFISRRYLSFLFWPTSTEKQAHANLRWVLHRLRKNLPDDNQYIQIDNKSLKWNTSASYRYDVAEFKKTVKLAEYEKVNNHIFSQKTALIQAVKLYKGDLLLNCYEKWIEPARKDLQNEFLKALESLCALLQIRKEYKKAIHYAEELIKNDNYNESSYRKLMRLYSLNGDRAKAIQIYRACADLFKKEFEMSPSRKTTELYKVIKADKYLETV